MLGALRIDIDEDTPRRLAESGIWRPAPLEPVRLPAAA
jgi:hypothetical protein